MSHAPPPPPPAPPAPALPPNSGLPAGVDLENFCLLHKGPIEGEVYECSTCHARYCRQCVLEAKQAGNARACVRCKMPFLL